MGDRNNEINDDVKKHGENMDDLILANLYFTGTLKMSSSGSLFGILYAISKKSIKI